MTEAIQDTPKLKEEIEERVEKAIQEFKPNPAFEAASAMIPQNLKQVMDLAMIMCKSGLVPKEMIGRPEACAMQIMFGLEVGLTPTQSSQNIMVVNGRPSLWGDAVKALVVGSRKCELFDEDPPHIALEQGFGRCHLVRKKEWGGGEVEIRFSVDDAKRAKLWTKPGPWQDYTGRMLMYRARGWACRDLFGDVLKGMQMREEVDDYEILEPKTVPMPQKRAETGQGAPNVVEAELAPETTSNALPAKSSEEIRGIQNKQPTETSDVGDAQEPDPTLRITEDRRKSLFQMWTKAKIELPAIKTWCQEREIAGTAEMTWEQSYELEVWISKQKK